MSYVNRTTRAPKTLTEAEQRALLRVTGERRGGLRDHVIFSLALGTGLREHEILALNVGDVFEGGRARRRLQLKVFKRSNPNPELQEVILPDSVRRKLDQLMHAKRADGHPIDEDAPVFLSRNARRLSARQLRDCFRAWQERAGFERTFTFHALRHTACTNLYRQTQDIRLTQRFARHLSILSTAVYTHPTDEDLVRSVQNLTC